MNTPLPCPDGALLHAILRGSVSHEQELEIARHLEDCSQCRAVVEMLCIDDGPITEPSSDASLAAPRNRKVPDPVDTTSAGDSTQCDARTD
jgi:anti-sigma factor RsiW